MLCCSDIRCSCFPSKCESILVPTAACHHPMTYVFFMEYAIVICDVESYASDVPCIAAMLLPVWQYMVPNNISFQNNKKCNTIYLSHKKREGKTQRSVVHKNEDF